MPGPHINYTSPAATAYAQSLLELADERKQAEPIGQELSSLRDVITADRAFQLFLQDPRISEEERRRVIDNALAPQLSPLVLNFLRVLNMRGRLGLLVSIIDAYDDLLDQKLGKVEVDVTTAQKLPPEQLEEVRRRVSQALGKDAVVHQYVDESIIGGLILRVQDRLIDSSVRTQLRAMREKLLGARPK